MRATFATLAAVALLVSAPVAQTKTAKPAKHTRHLRPGRRGRQGELVGHACGRIGADRYRQPGARDTDRIMAVLTEAGVKEIDYLHLTHYHVDHIGGLQELAKRIPIEHYIDHGPSVEEREQVPASGRVRRALRPRRSTPSSKPGDKLP